VCRISWPEDFLTLRYYRSVILIWNANRTSRMAVVEWFSPFLLFPSRIRTDSSNLFWRPNSISKTFYFLTAQQNGAAFPASALLAKCDANQLNSNTGLEMRRQGQTNRGQRAVGADPTSSNRLVNSNSRGERLLIRSALPCIHSGPSYARQIYHSLFENVKGPTAGKHVVTAEIVSSRISVLIGPYL